MFPKRYRHFVFGVIQSGLTCAVAAAIASLPFVAGFVFLEHWLRSWLLSWLAMLPIVLLAAPYINRLVDRLAADDPA